MDSRCRHHHVGDAEGERAGIKGLITFCFPGCGLMQRCAVQKRKAFPLLMFRAGMTPG